MDDVLDNLISFMESVVADMDNIDDEEFDQIMAFMEEAMTVIAQEQTRQQPPTPPVEPPIPLGSDLLWQLAGGNPEAFTNYLRTVPDPHLNAIARNPEHLERVLRQLQEQFPQPEEQPVAAGIEKAPLNSSNIWGFHYNKQSGDLLVRFQGGNVYHYGGVPAGIFQIFQAGAIPAKTDGQNAYGKWWRGKNPSLGAAFHELIRNGGYEYEQVA